MLTQARGGVDRRMVMLSGLVAIAMLAVGLMVAAFGVLVLKLAGGAAGDTSRVVLVAAYAVTDFWGGGIIGALVRRSSRDVAVAWLIARVVLLTVLSVVIGGFIGVAVVQAVLAAPAAWLGATMGYQQAQLRDRERVRAHREAERRAARVS